MRKVVLIVLMVLNVSAFSFFDSKPKGQCSRVDYFVSVKDLVIATQKTRGLTNSFLNGNVVAQLLVYHERKEMKKALKILTKQSEDGEAIIDTKNKARIDKLAIKIKKLNKSAFKRPSQEVFDAYTAIVEETLSITKSMVTRNCKKCEPLAQDAVDTMINTLLPLTENIGKTRGLGSGMVARGSATKEESIKLKAYIEEIKRLRFKMELEMKQLTHRYANAYGSGVSVTTKKLNNMLTAYVNETTTHVINNNKITLDANTYFDEGSAVISEVLKLYAINREAIRGDD